MFGQKDAEKSSRHMSMCVCMCMDACMQIDTHAVFVCIYVHMDLNVFSIITNSEVLQRHLSSLSTYCRGRKGSVGLGSSHMLSSHDHHFFFYNVPKASACFPELYQELFSTSSVCCLCNIFYCGKNT